MYLFKKNAVFLKRGLEFCEGALLPGLIFFFLPDAPFDVADVAKGSRFNGDGHLHQEGEDEEPCRPDTEGHNEL